MGTALSAFVANAHACMPPRAMGTRYSLLCKRFYGEVAVTTCTAISSHCTLRVWRQPSDIFNSVSLHVSALHLTHASGLSFVWSDKQRYAKRDRCHACEFFSRLLFLCPSELLISFFLSFFLNFLFNCYYLIIITVIITMLFLLLLLLYYLLYILISNIYIKNTIRFKILIIL